MYVSIYARPPNGLLVTYNCFSMRATCPDHRTLLDLKFCDWYTQCESFGVFFFNPSTHSLLCSNILLSTLLLELILFPFWVRDQLSGIVVAGNVVVLYILILESFDRRQKMGLKSQKRIPIMQRR
jgi:hypothetical protein